MTDEQKLEYQEIRDEYALLTQMISTTVNFSVVGSVALFSFLSANSNPSFILFGLPLLIIYPGCFIILSRIQNIFKLAAYLIVFIEPKSDIQFETRLLRFKKRSKIRFSKTILLVFLGLILINVGLFISKGYFSFWNISFYALSLLFYCYIYYLIAKDWKKIFIKSWEEVKRYEDNCR